ncbi:hypothetical protein [Rathayibacter tritici]|uniref:hypothetical protein n=1 Tax=Rathayibacter tritici TaxID=33888 RepID=UPI00082F4223|nr:hypothetical protein [Rathayibacter tritici]PPF24651.1 hypothetical protein C5C06_12880 [Rathayibacter tritici]PPI17652.1 hypothetical protein C5D07_04540 [Rathayibacter tritici]PPI47075.1 hypothetical protein C5D18_04530 [Rathayibacter tritici]
MSNQGNQGPMSVKFTPWGVLAVSLVGGVAGAGVSAAVGAGDPWNVVITAVVVAVVLLFGWAVVNLRQRRRFPR